MALQFHDLLRCTVAGTNGELGKLKDILFDDQSCKIRYFVVDTAKWLPGKKVLLAPSTLSWIDQEAEVLHFDLTKEKIEESPDLETDLPVSRQYEKTLHNYYGWTPYWTATPAVGAWFPYPGYAVPYGDGQSYAAGYPEEWRNAYDRRQENFDEHLRSCHEVQGYKIASSDDEEFGEVLDLILEDEKWLVIDLVLSSRRWLPGGKLMVCSPLFVTRIDELNKLLHVSLPKAALMESPNYDPRTYGEGFRRSLVEHYLQASDSGEIDMARLRQEERVSQGF